MGYNVLTSGFFVALAKPKAALTLSLARGIVVILVCLLILSSALGSMGIWLTPTVSEGLCLIISLILMRSTRPFAAA